MSVYPNLGFTFARVIAPFGSVERKSDSSFSPSSSRAFERSIRGTLTTRFFLAALSETRWRTGTEDYSQLAKRVVLDRPRRPRAVRFSPAFSKRRRRWQ